MNTMSVKRKNLLNYLEQRGADVAPGCRNGFCGACRYPKSQVDVAWEYDDEPLACYEEHEVVTCCAYLTTVPTPSKEG